MVMAKVIFVQAEYEGEIVLSEEVISYFKKNRIKSVALFASAQFLNFGKIIKQLNELGIEAVVSKTKRSEKAGQILGCNIYENNFEPDTEKIKFAQTPYFSSRESKLNFRGAQEPEHAPDFSPRVLDIFKQADAVLYIGDGAFHPSALLFAGAKTVLVYNPISEKMNLLSSQDIEKNNKKMQISSKRFLMAKNIGIFVSLKPGQEYLQIAHKLKNRLKNKGDKNVYVFVGNEFNFLDLENFNFIEAWVNSACPRIGTDDILNISKPIVNIKDAFEPAKILEKLN